jgi:hypothetical protein
MFSISNRVLTVYRPVAGEMVNQMVSTAVNAANRAAANAYTTCKEVFYTWQARTYQVQFKSALLFVKPCRNP